MNVDKPAKSESASESGAESHTVLSDWDDDGDSLAVAEQWRRIRVMVSRAAVVYLILFIGLGVMMSAVGVNPLANGGLMPKALLVFVGLALVVALASDWVDLWREQRRNWLRLVRGRKWMELEE